MNLLPLTLALAATVLAVIGFFFYRWAVRRRVRYRVRVECNGVVCEITVGPGGSSGDLVCVRWLRRGCDFDIVEPRRWELLVAWLVPPLYVSGVLSGLYWVLGLFLAGATVGGWLHIVLGVLVFAYSLLWIMMVVSTASQELADVLEGWWVGSMGFVDAVASSRLVHLGVGIADLLFITHLLSWVSGGLLLAAVVLGILPGLPVALRWRVLVERARDIRRVAEKHRWVRLFYWASTVALFSILVLLVFVGCVAGLQCTVGLSAVLAAVFVAMVFVHVVGMPRPVFEIAAG